jgi:hypothetical protein
VKVEQRVIFAPATPEIIARNPYHGIQYQPLSNRYWYERESFKTQAMTHRDLEIREIS